MSTPPIPHHFEFELVVTGTPQQVWRAVATAAGISSWMMATELDERLGGELRFDMGPGAASHGRVTGYDENRRIAYEEDWATLAGHPDADVTPLATEFLIEASSGGTCVVRVVSNAYGTGADWENEFWGGMEQGWAPMLGHLATYLAHFADELATPMGAWTEVPATAADVITRTKSALGIPADGSADVNAPVDGAGLHGTIEQISDIGLSVLVDAPFRGFLAINTYVPTPDAPNTSVMVHTYSFGPSADIDWQQWIESVARGTDG